MHETQAKFISDKKVAERYGVRRQPIWNHLPIF